MMFADLYGAAKERCGKTQFAEKRRPPGLKPALITLDLRGPFGKLRAGSEGPLFHGDAQIHSFFRKL